MFLASGALSRAGGARERCQHGVVPKSNAAFQTVPKRATIGDVNSVASGPKPSEFK